jgi:hypothetical protein
MIHSSGDSVAENKAAKGDEEMEVGELFSTAVAC